MFTPEINFLKDRTVAAGSDGYTPPAVGAAGGPDPLLVGAAVPIAALAVMAGLTLYFNSQVSTKETELNELAGRAALLDRQLNDVRQLRTDIDNERKRVEAVVNLFDLSRPWSAVMEDLRRRVPEGVWLNVLSSATTKEGDIVTLEGFALRFEDVAALQLTLRDSPFVADAIVVDAVKEEGKDGTPATVAYKIEARLTERKLRELVTALEKTGAVGLLEKLRRVQREQLVR
ncbi:PilN domain-containing protein [Gloeobacter violaceus]|uniref:Glr2435 protein n=1 Tax=Gloeobacter violaceus (strain ATCC 29082 / PCC 7421) TaxID=251221 RepID=Q7NHV0_GLOVI|nr:PilN domain-containing protein [Gloeobacter violaceus]BAC90376.1 glr2435 [Gloeobacter violaceus PCC 7421]